MGGKKGFTLVELALSVGFIALLSLTITLIINDTVATYRRGLTLNDITTTGMDLVDDMRSAIQNSPARAASYECEGLYDGGVKDTDNTQARRCYVDSARNLVMLERKAMVKTELDDSSPEVELPVYGVICTGEFSYIWNSGYFFGENAGGEIANTDATVSRVESGVKPATFRYNSNNNGGAVVEYGPNEGSKGQFRLLKVKDEYRGVCKTAIKESAVGQPTYGTYHDDPAYYYSSLTDTFDLTTGGSKDPVLDFYGTNGIRDEDVEIVMADDVTNQLALYDLTLTPPVSNSSGKLAFYSASFILGTVTGGINIAAKGNFCDAPQDYYADFDYCAINKFNFAAQATGG